MSIVKDVKRRLRYHLPKPLVEVIRGRWEGARFLLSPDLSQRWALLGQFEQISRSIECTQAESETLLAARHLLDLDAAVDGMIVECGCYKGGSTAKLSLVAKAIGRRLVVCDSFRGIPPEGSKTGEGYFNFLDGGVRVHFLPGDYSANVGEVKTNVTRWGCVDVVDFLPGYFEQTLPGFKGAVAGVILDVDLVSSTETCLRYLWPQMSRGGLLFSQDAHLREVVDLFASPIFWPTVGVPVPPRFEGLNKKKMVFARKQ